MLHGDKPDCPVDQRRSSEPGQVSECQGPLGHGPGSPDHPRCSPGPPIGTEHDLGMQHGDEGLEVPLPRSGKKAWTASR